MKPIYATLGTGLMALALYAWLGADQNAPDADRHDFGHHRND